MAKVLLMATFTYQLAYWGWVKLEKDEIKRSKNGERCPIDGEDDSGQWLMWDEQQKLKCWSNDWVT